MAGTEAGPRPVRSGSFPAFPLPLAGPRPGAGRPIRPPARPSVVSGRPKAGSRLGPLFLLFSFVSLASIDHCCVFFSVRSICSLPSALLFFFFFSSDRSLLAAGLHRCSWIDRWTVSRPARPAAGRPQTGLPATPFFPHFLPQRSHFCGPL